jgi:hypothetical protein
MGGNGATAMVRVVEEGRGKQGRFVGSGRRLGGCERAGVRDLGARAVGITEGATMPRGAHWSGRRSDGGINRYKINRREWHRRGNDAIDGTLTKKLFEQIFYASEAREWPVGGKYAGNHHIWVPNK